MTDHCHWDLLVWIKDDLGAFLEPRSVFCNKTHELLTVIRNQITQDPIVQRALLLMQQNMDTPISIQDIALRMGNSKRQIERHFRLGLNTSPQAAFLDMRLDFAKHLVEKTQKSIAQIAVDCGFCDSSHLSRMFRRRYNGTPKSFRKQPIDMG